MCEELDRFFTARPYYFVGHPLRCAHWVHRAMRDHFSAEIDGFPGDEDNGSMSAWYIWGALGLYPLNPTIPRYTLSVPFFSAVTVHMDNGNDIRIERRLTSNVVTPGVRYLWNGAALAGTEISHSTLRSGGTLAVEVDAQAFSDHRLGEQRL